MLSYLVHLSTQGKNYTQIYKTDTSPKLTNRHATYQNLYYNSIISAIKYIECIYTSFQSFHFVNTEHNICCFVLSHITSVTQCHVSIYVV